MITLFLLDGFFLWGAVGFCATILGSCVYAENYALATFDILAFVALLSVTGNFNIASAWAFCLHNPLIIVGALACFLAVGVAWSRIKWGLLMDGLKQDVDVWKASIDAVNKANAASFEMAQADHAIWKNKTQSERQWNSTASSPPTEPVMVTMSSTSIPYELRGRIKVNDDGTLSVQVDRFKSRIIGWMAYWPVSMLLWFTGDFIHDLFNKLYLGIRGYFQRLGDAKLNS